MYNAFGRHALFVRGQSFSVKIFDRSRSGCHVIRLVVSFAAVFRLVTQSSSRGQAQPHSQGSLLPSLGENPGNEVGASLKTAAKETVRLGAGDDFRGPPGQSLLFPSRVSLSRARSFLRPHRLL